MKRILAMAVLVAASTSIFAQEDAVKEAKKLLGKGQTAEAIQTLTPALSNGTAQSKAEAYNTLCDINYKVFSDQQEIVLNNQIKQTQTPHDTVAMNNAVMGMIESALKCDEFDNQPNEKGKVKPKFRSANGTKYFLLRQQLIQPGSDLFNKHDYTGAAKYWNLYLDSYNAPLFEKQDKAADKNIGQISYFASVANYYAKDFDKARKYALMAEQDTAYTKDALQIELLAQKEGLKTKEDTLGYVNRLKELHKSIAGDTQYFGMMNEYYSQKGREAEKNQWIEDELKTNPNNTMAWGIKGEDAMNAKKWDEAVACFDKASQIDPKFVQVIAYAGACLCSKGMEMKDQLADKSGRLSADNDAKIKDTLNKAVSYLQKAQALDPDCEKVNWAYPLKLAYYQLGDEAKYKEIEAMGK